jgi:predicted RNA-binding protein (virulence factor B family)
MFNLGEFQELRIVKSTEHGVYLQDVDCNIDAKVLLPKNQVEESFKKGDIINVFIYKDSMDRLIATTTTPLITLGGLATLKVTQVNNVGAFLDWGLAKDLLLPYKEQSYPVKVDDEVLVSMYIDKSNRLCATTKVYDVLRTDSPYQKDDMVEGIVYDTSDEFGVFVAVDNQYSALIPKKEVFGKMRVGQTVKARVTAVKADGKLDLSVRDKIPAQMDKDANLIWTRLQEYGGSVPFTDKADPEVIKREFNLSKNAFKRAVGRLLKEGKIEIGENTIKVK